MTTKTLIDLYSVKAEDQDVIKCQIKSDNVQLAGVVERCKYGFPSIFLLCPDVNNNAETISPEQHKQNIYNSISNVLWLSCPYLNKQIHAIESDGAVQKIQNFIHDDRELVEQMNQAHAHYYFLRKHLYNHYHKNNMFVENCDLFNSGIGGIKDIKNIKCLHMHYAHYRLYNQNIVGQITYEMLNKNIYCKENDCKKCLKKVTK